MTWMDSMSVLGKSADASGGAWGGGGWNGSAWGSPAPAGVTQSQNGPFGTLAQPNGGFSPWSNDRPGGSGVSANAAGFNGWLFNNPVADYAQYGEGNALQQGANAPTQEQLYQHWAGGGMPTMYMPNQPGGSMSGYPMMWGGNALQGNQQMGYPVNNALNLGFNSSFNSGFNSGYPSGYGAGGGLYL